MTKAQPRDDVASQKGPCRGGVYDFGRKDAAKQAQFRFAAREFLLPGEKERISVCGSRFVGVTQSGIQRPWHMRCGHRYCKTCGRERRGRIVGVLERRFAEKGWSGAYMLTLTHACPMASTAYPWGARAAIEELRDHYARAYDLVRRQDIGLRRVKPQTRARWRALIVPVHRQGKNVPKKVRNHRKRTWSKTFRGGKFEGAGKDWFRALELKITDNTYHAHLHIITPCLATAERLNAAWQQTRTQESMCQTDIEQLSTRRACSYASKYATKGAEALETTSKAWIAAAVNALRGVRLTNGAGALRNLGLRRQAGDDPCTHVRWEGELVPIAWLYQQPGCIPVSKDALHNALPYDSQELCQLKEEQFRNKFKHLGVDGVAVHAALAASRPSLNISHTLCHATDSPNDVSTRGPARSACSGPATAREPGNRAPTHRVGPGIRGPTSRANPARGPTGAATRASD